MNCKLFFISVLFFSLAFIGCSSSSEDLDLNKNVDNLYKVALKKDTENLWARELESIRLVTDISKSEKVNSVIRLSPITMVTAENEDDPIYPALKDFGSLDISSFSEQQLSLINSICENISKLTLNKIITDKIGINSLVMFKNDLINSWEALFNSKFPVLIAEVQNGEKPVYLFSDYLIGKPFDMDSALVVPVRFFNKDNKLDLHIYINTQKEPAFLQVLMLNY